MCSFTLRTNPSKRDDGNLWFLLYYYRGQLYPTVLRQTTIGFFSLVSCIGSFSSSYAATFFAQIWQPLPAIVFSSTCVLAALAVLVLPRGSDNAALPDTVDDAKQLDELVPMQQHRRQSQVSAGNKREF